MKKYNRSLDLLAMALVYTQKGDATKAAKLLMKASKSPDAEHAVSVIEASNAAAYAAEEKAKIEAAKASKVGAASEEDESEEDISDIIGDDEGQATATTATVEDGEQEMGEHLAAVLAGIIKPAAKK